MKDEDMVNLSIPAELHRQLMVYCENKGIPLADFIEDSLENAIDVEEQYEVMRQTKQINRNIANEREKFYQHGVEHGFICAFFMGQGRLGSAMRNDTLENSIKKNPFKIVTGSQMELF